MAKKSIERKQKSPGRIKQMWQVYQTTKTHDRKLTLWLLLSFFGPIIAGVLIAWLTPGNIFSWVLWIVTGLLTGLLIGMIVLGRRAEATAYRQIAGRAGAVGAVVQNALRRSWRGSEMPVAINPRTQDAIYRVVGKGGVVLISEGPSNRTKKMKIDEERKVKRVLPTVQVTHITVGPDPDSVPLENLSRRLLKLKKTLSKQEVLAVDNRLTSLQQAQPGIGIPKGIDPTKVRAQKPR
ncbi:MAG TPA: DUF4191 domain-containing protein [Microbacteriaceae bacterium]|nr:DUF4191 domain-containing protein [Microbacteriaceae bacterium]